MALHWDLRNIKDSETVRTSPFGKDKQHPLLYWLIMAMTPIGQREITEKTKAKVFERLCIYQKMTGPALQFTDTDTKELIDVYCTMEDVERYIGLSVNVSPETDAEFAKKVRRWAMDKWYTVSRSDNPDALSAYDWCAKRAAETEKMEGE